MFKKFFVLAAMMAAMVLGLSPSDGVHAEPSDPNLPRITGAPVTLWKDTNADGVYDTRVYEPDTPGAPDTYTDLVGLWEIEVTDDDLYLVIEADVEALPALIAGDIAEGVYPNGNKLNGLTTNYWEESNYTTIFGDIVGVNNDEDILLDTDVTTCNYRSNFCGDYRLWDMKNGGSKAIVIHIDNTTAGYDDLHGWLWEQIPPDKAPL